MENLKLQFVLDMKIWGSIWYFIAKSIFERGRGQ